eukprot:INCI3814.1.p1 GENE.INCI3814.1~~INCI3814.1.p1  ORF type:complete len:492 (+),score=89.78 INCI3814.1:131-1477(+)
MGDVGRRLLTALGLVLLVFQGQLDGAEAGKRSQKWSDSQIKKFIKEAVRDIMEGVEDEDADVDEDEDEALRRRQLESVPNLADYSGVKINKDNAVLTMGENHDVMLLRSGPEQLDILASVNVTGELRVNSSLCGCFSEDRVRDIVNEVINGKDSSSNTTCPATCAGYTCDQLFTIFDKSCVTLEEASCDCGGCACLGDASSCKEILQRAPSSSSGAYSIRLADGTIEDVMCDMKTSSGGWTLVATVTSAGTAWQFGDDNGDLGDPSSAWESDNTFGDFDVATDDFKANAYNVLPKDQIMITYNGDHLLTTRGCHNDTSMKDMFNGLQFIAGGSSECTSSNWKTCVDSNYKCAIEHYTSITGELALVHSTTIQNVYLKWGEKDGAEDGNKDRVYISTDARGTSTNLLDYCQGLGAFVSYSGTEVTVNVGEEDDGASTVGSGHDYQIWVR